MRWICPIVFLLTIVIANSASALAGDSIPSTEPIMQPSTNTSTEPGAAAIAQCVNAFALDLYGQLGKAEGNLFFSPFSVDVALMMVRAGAADATADEMTRTLKLPSSDATDLDGAIAALSGRFQSGKADKGYELHVASALWGQAGASFLPAFLDNLRLHYAAELGTVDFHKSGEAAKMINDWVSGKTNDRIKDLVGPSTISAQTKLILTNAIYFKGDWLFPFQAKSTHDVPWNDGRPLAAGGQPNNVAMMSQRGAFDYLDGTGFAALQMPYKGGDLAMVVLLPDDPAHGLADLQRSMDAAKLAQIVNGLQHVHHIELSFPKFQLKTRYDLAPTLATMGMPTAFSTAADFSGMDGSRDLQISGVIHQAFVKVDETGTEAAGATAVGMRSLAMRRRTVFRVDHPFLFVIRDMKSGTVLFMGRVVDPTK